MSSTVVVHTTPPLDPLPASDAESLELLGILRLAGLKPGLLTADWSANGKPFVTHAGIAISKRYFDSLPGYSSPDSPLSTNQRADAVEWATYIDGRVSDLVNHTLYSLPQNYPVLARAQLACCPFPTNHYIPQRLRGIHKARLEAVGIWGLGGVRDGEEETQKRLEDTMIVGPGGTQAPRAWSWKSGRESVERKRKFGEEALLRRARDVFDPLARKIGQNKWFYGTPSSLDIALWSHLTLLLTPPWPNPILGDLLRSTYPALVKHHDRMQKKLGAWPDRLAAPALPSAVDSVRSYLPAWLGGPAEEANIVDSKEKEKERAFRYGRYAWFAGAGLALITYVLASGIVQIDLSGDEDEEEWIVVGEDDEEADDEETEGQSRFSGLVYGDDDEEEDVA